MPNKNPEGHSVSELALLDQARQVPIPYDGGPDYVCPKCERAIPLEQQIRFAKPPRYEGVLNDVMKCPLKGTGPKERSAQRARVTFTLAWLDETINVGDRATIAPEVLAERQRIWDAIYAQQRQAAPRDRCGFIFSPRSTATVIRG